MSGLIGRKIGMTSIFDENGKNIPCTVMKLVHVLLPKSEPKVLTGTKRCNWVSMTKRETFHKSGLRSL
jgi:ribosomal protein L3